MDLEGLLPPDGPPSRPGARGPGPKNAEAAVGAAEAVGTGQPDVVCADRREVYPAVIPAAFLLQSKAETVAIERNNGRQRHWFARFRRKSIVVSKSAGMVDLTMGLFAAYHVNKTWNPAVHFKITPSLILNGEIQGGREDAERFSPGWTSGKDGARIAGFSGL